MTAIAPVPGSSTTAYAGAAGGGVWKTTDGGTTWAALTEDLNDLSVGAIAVAPTNPQVIYVGTGEGGYSATFIPGIGFLKSTDGGATWILPQSVLATTFYRILVHPTDGNDLVAGTNAGAFRSTDGGATWTNVIRYADYGDVPDIVRDPGDPRVLYATTWCALRNCTNRSARVLKSSDGGSTWTDRSTGLPSPASGRSERTSIAISRTDPRVLYAARSIRDFVVTGLLFSHIYKTTDAGETWAELPSVSGDPNLSLYMGSQGYYDNTITVSPRDANVVIAGGVYYVRSTDGGTTFTYAFDVPGAGIHPDCHELRYEGTRLWIANDGGIYTSDDDGKNGADHNQGLITRQFYSLANDPVHRDRIIAGAQDNGTVQRLEPGTTWRPIEGADGLGCAVLPHSPDTAWISAQGSFIERTNAVGAGGEEPPPLVNVTPPFDDDELFPFYTVVKLDRRESSTLYTTSTRVWRSRDGGDSWRPLPIATSDGSTWSDLDTIYSVALPATDSPLMIVAKGRGVFRSADGGATWSAGHGLPDAIVNAVEIDPRDPRVAYACIATTTGPSLFRSSDGGLTWTASASGLPPFAAHVLSVDPTDSSDLFCGTDVGVFRSTDGGASWARFGSGLPAASVHDVQILDDASIVRVATYGRGIWELRVPSSGNSAPAAAIASPAGAVSILKGDAVDFSGVVADADPGDSADGAWFFPDDATRVPLPAGSASVRHVFRRTGVFQVALSARDRHGGLGAASVTVDVREPADACATPIAIPGAGPFPYTVALNDEAGTPEATDVRSTVCFAGFAASGSTWLAFTPAASGSYTFSICAGGTFQLVSLFTGDACGPYSPVATACDSFGGRSIACGFGASSMSASLAQGQTYRILLGATEDSARGPVAMTVDAGAPSETGPRIRLLSQPSGPTTGGTDVLVAGERFTNADSVAFDGIPASDVQVLSQNVIAARSPSHPAGPADVSVTVPGEGTSTLGKGFVYEAAPTRCVAGGTALCLNGGRFRVSAEWSVPAQGQSGHAAAVPLTADTGYFWFFSSNNIELVVKVVDGRSFNGKFWVFYGALSNVEYRITVTDSVTGDVKVYTNPSGQLASVADTAAF